MATKTVAIEVANTTFKPSDNFKQRQRQIFKSLTDIPYKLRSAEAFRLTCEAFGIVYTDHRPAEVREALGLDTPTYEDDTLALTYEPVEAEASLEDDKDQLKIAIGDWIQAHVDGKVKARNDAGIRAENLVELLREAGDKSTKKELHALLSNMAGRVDKPITASSIQQAIYNQRTKPAPKATALGDIMSALGL